MKILRLVNWFAIDPGPSTGWLQTIKGNQFNCVACASRNLTISQSRNLPFLTKLSIGKLRPALENVSLEALIPIGPDQNLYIDLASLTKIPVIYYVVQILGSASFKKELW